MPFISKEELNDKDRELERLRRNLASTQGELATALAAGHIVERVTERLKQEEANGTLENHARDVVTFQLEQESRDDLTKNLAARLRDTMRETIDNRVRTKEGPTIRSTLDDMYQADGTYALIEQTVRASIRDDIAGDLRAQAATDEAMRLEETSDERAAFIEIVKTELARDGSIDAVRADVRAEFETDWEKQARDEIVASIKEEVLATEDDFKSQWKKKYKETYEFSRMRDNTLREARGEIESKSLEELADTVRSDAIQQILNERIEIENKKNKTERCKVEREALEKSLTGAGLSMESFEEGVEMCIFLGTEKEDRIDRATYPKGLKKPDHYHSYDIQLIQVQRSIQAIATSEPGHFRVRSDSLQDSKSPYDQDAAITPGTIITMGRTTVKNGSPVYEHKINIGANLVIDDNMEDEHTVDTFLPIAAVMVNDVMAPLKPYRNMGKNAFS